jgi:hypothetical protein
MGRERAMQYRKKPLVVDAIKNTGDWQSIMTWLDEIGYTHPGDVSCHNGTLMIITLDGVMRADVGDWLIRGIAGEFYPCKARVFVDSYELVDGGESPS